MRTESEVTAVDTVGKTVTVRHGEETYKESYDRLVLSPGAAPIRPAIPGIEENKVFTLRNIPRYLSYLRPHKGNCAQKLCGDRSRLYRSGNGRKSCRTRCACNSCRGCFSCDAPIDMDMAHQVHNYIRAQGIDLYLGQTCTAMDKDGVILKDGRKIPADMVILSIGVRPDTGFLKDSGIELGARGEILVNSYMETSAPDVYALGDAASVRHIVSGKQVLIPLASRPISRGVLLEIISVEEKRLIGAVRVPPS